MKEKGSTTLHLLLILLVLVLILGGVYRFTQGKILPLSVITQQSNPDWKKYINKQLNFEVLYPAQYNIRDWDSYYNLHVNPDFNDGHFDITDTNSSNKFDFKEEHFGISFRPIYFKTMIITDEGSLSNNEVDTTSMTFKDFTEKSLLASCIAEGAEGSTRCDKIISINPFQSPNKMNGYKVYLHHLEEGAHVESGQRSGEYTSGPIYFVDISGQHKANIRALRIELYYGPYVREEEITDPKMLEILEKTINSIKFIN